MTANVVTLFWRGVLRRSSFLGNLKASDKKLGLWKTLTWIKYYPSICCFQYFKVIFEGLGLVFKHFYKLRYIVLCRDLITCLIFTRGWLCFPKSSSNLPYKCKEQHWKKKHFPQFPTIGSCSTLLTPKEPKSMWGQLEVWVGSSYINFHCDFLKLFLEIEKCTSFVGI
jgi:hypothetical protein